MTIKNFDVPATLINGEPIIDESKKQVSYGWLIAEAVGTLFEDEKHLNGIEKFKRGELQAKIIKGGDIDLTIEELNTIKTTVGKRWPIQYIYQIFNFVEGST